ncbi:MAG TPA: UbiA family prenyltransferase [Candidatus Limnocylindrales bacterium]|nr:UbiA family prenyltransferase [Candidatus Limnocylindrales bacterium]
MGAVAGGAPAVVLLLALGMLAFQVSIGATNDLADRAADGLSKPAKPIPAGLVSPAMARGVALGGGLLGLLATLLVAMLGAGWPVVAVGLAGYGLGIAYDLRLKRAGLGWLAYALALPLLPAYAVLGATGRLTPVVLLAMAAAVPAGIALALANSLLDATADRRAGVGAVAVRLGEPAARRLMAGTQAAVVAGAWATALWLTAGHQADLRPLLLASLAVGGGVALQLGGGGAARQRGWELQVLGVALLGVAWLVAVGLG